MYFQKKAIKPIDIAILRGNCNDDESRCTFDSVFEIVADSLDNPSMKDTVVTN
jgi:hypothetical protein